MERILNLVVVGMALLVGALLLVIAIMDKDLVALTLAGSAFGMGGWTLAITPRRR